MSWAACPICWTCRPTSFQISQPGSSCHWSALLRLDDAQIHPVFVVEGAEVVMATHLLAAVRRSAIGARVASLVDHRAAIIGAIDVLSSVV
jgi:hypothetical protein